MPQTVIVEYRSHDFKDWLQMSLDLFKDYPPEDTERGLKFVLQNVHLGGRNEQG